MILDVLQKNHRVVKAISFVYPILFFIPSQWHHYYSRQKIQTPYIINKMNLSSSAIGIKEDKSYIVPNYKIIHQRDYTKGNRNQRRQVHGNYKFPFFLHLQNLSSAVLKQSNKLETNIFLSRRVIIQQPPQENGWALCFKIASL